MARPKICIVTHTFLPHVGGIERVVYEQSKRLLKRGFDVQVLTSLDRSGKNYSVDGINVRCYESVNFGFRLGIPYSIPQFTSFGTFLRSVMSSDVVHVHGHPYLSSLFASKLAKRCLKPIVLTQHNTYIDYNGIWNTFESLNDLSVGRENLKLADRIIAISDATKQYVVRLGAKSSRVNVIHNGVDIDRFKWEPNVRELLRAKLGIPQDACVALTVRRLVFKNGIDTLLESARIAVSRNPKLVFLVIGKGPDLEEARAVVVKLGIKSNFKLAGFVSDEELPRYYSAADFFVLPSKSGEGLPLVALEAMASDLPIVATNVGGIKEVMIRDFGRVVPPNDVEALAGAIVEFSNMDFRSRRGQLRLVVEQSNGWEQNVDKLVKIYEELI
jgi:glycosyltransferase involved in cell wall biosynthesis